MKTITPFISQILHSKFQTNITRNILTLILCLCVKLTYSQTEGSQDTATRYYDKVYDETYAVDTIEYRDTITVNLNDSLEIDSFELGSIHEYTFNVDDRRSIPTGGNGTGATGTPDRNSSNNSGRTQVSEQVADVNTSCGCTNPTWYTQPIPPGETGWLKIKYNATIPDKKISVINVFIKNSVSIKVIAIIPVKVIAIVKNVPSPGN